LLPGRQSVSALGRGLLLLLDTLPLYLGYLLFALLGGTGTAFTLLRVCSKDACPPEYAGMSTSIVDAAQLLGVGVLQPAFGRMLDRGRDGALQCGVQVYSVGSIRTSIALPLVPMLVGIAHAMAMREQPYAAEPRS
jgi:hypothetical protein